MMETDIVTQPEVPTYLKFIGWFLWTAIILFFIFLVIVKRKDMWAAVKGNDGQLDRIDIVLVMWIVMFVGMGISDIALDMYASKDLWTAMDLIGGVVLGLRGTKDIMQNKNGNGKPKQESEAI